MANIEEENRTKSSLCGKGRSNIAKLSGKEEQRSSENTRYSSEITAVTKEQET